MSIKRTHKLNQKKWLKENSHLKILDLGCTHVNYWPEANNFADIEDYSEYFKVETSYNILVEKIADDIPLL